MKSLIWIVGLFLFLGLTGLAFWVAPPSVAAVGPDAASVDRRSVLEGLRKEVDIGYTRVQSALEDRVQSLESASCSADIEVFSSALRVREVDRLSRERADEELRTALAASVARESLDFAFLIAPDGVPLATSVVGGVFEFDERQAARLQLFGEKFFRGGGCSASFELLPAAVTGLRVELPDSHAESPLLDRSRDNGGLPVEDALALVVARPVWTRPDMPAALLVLGLAADAVLQEAGKTVDAAVGTDLDWHLFSNPEHRDVRVIAGQRLGERVRRGLLRELILDSATDRPAFPEVGAQVGRWRALRSHEGHLVGGWGVTVGSAALDTALAPVTASRQLVAAVLEPRTYDAVVIGVLVLAGLGVLGIFLALWSRLVRPTAVASGSSAATRQAVVSGVRQELDRQSAEWQQVASTVSAAQTSVERVERNFEEFVGRSEARIQEKLRLMAETPAGLSEELREQFASLFGRVEEFQTELRETRTDVGALASHADEGQRGVVDSAELDKVGTHFVALSDRLEGVENRLTGFFETLEKQIEATGENRVTDELTRVKAGWASRIADIGTEVECLRDQAADLVEDLRKAREVEAALREEISAQQVVEDSLRSQLEEVHLRSEEAALQGHARARRVEELEAGSRQGGEEIGRLKARNDKLREEKHALLEEVAQLREAVADGGTPQKVDSASEKPTGSGFHETVSELYGGKDTSLESAEGAQNREEFLQLYEEVDRLRQEANTERDLREKLQAERAELEERLVEFEGNLREAAVSSEDESLVELQSEIAGLREEIDGIQGFQGALITGNLPSPMGAVDEGMKVFVWNPAAEEFWGVPAAEILGQNLHTVELEPVKMLERVIAEARRAMERGRSTRTDALSFSLSGGRSVTIRLCCEPIRDGDEKVIGAIFCIEDRTLAAQSEDERRLQSDFQDSLTGSLPMGLLVVDEELRVINWNVHATSLLDVAESDALGQPFLELATTIHGPELEEQLREACESGVPKRLLLSRTRGKGEVLLTTSPFVTEAGERRGWVLLVEEAVEEEVA